MPEEKWEKLEGGYYGEEVVRDENGAIVAIRSEFAPEQIIRVGDEVVANGRIFVPEGAKGTLLAIVEPRTHSGHHDIFEVLWEGGLYELPCPMKLKDFRF